MLINTVSDTVNFTSSALSNNFLKFINPSTSDTIDVIATNTDVKSGADSLGKNFSAQYLLSQNFLTGTHPLNANYFSKLNITNPGIWQLSEFVNGELVVPTNIILPEGDIFAYPNPFNYKNATAIYVPVAAGNNTTATLNIYSSSLNLYYSATKNVVNINGRKFVMWNARQTNNDKLSSGIYIYVTKLGDEVLKGKLVIFNE